MIKIVTAALGLVAGMAMGAGLAEAHDKAPRPNVTSESMDSLHDSDGGSQVDDGDEAELEGTLEILHEDREDGSGHYRHFLSIHDGKRLALEGARHPDLLTGDLVRVRGVRSGKTIQLPAKSAENLEVLQYAPLANTFGPQKVVVLLVNFSNDQSRPFTVSDMQYWMTFADRFYRENSYGQTSLSVDVFGWYTLPLTSTGCPYSSIATKADQAATEAGVRLPAYARRMYVFPYIAACGFSGAAYVGGNPSVAWINGNSGLMAIEHELGHNFGLYHSHSMSCAPAVLSTSGCTTREYGDTTDTMGGGGGHFNAFQKDRLGWLGFGVSPPITKVTRSGIYPLDDYQSPGTLPKALKIQRGATSQAFFVELRTPCAGCLEPGVFIHLATDGVGTSSYLLDMTPATPLWPSADLGVGKSFTDPVSGITITTVSISQDQKSAMIAVTMGGVPPSAPSTPTGLSGGPQLTWTPGTPATQTGFVVERAPGATALFASIATTIAPSYLDASGVPGHCYRVRAMNALGTSGPSNVACVTTPPPPPPGDVTLTITSHSPIGREMTFRGTLTGSTSLSATVDGIAVGAKYIVVDRTRKTWTVKATGLVRGPHTFTAVSGALAVSKSFTVPK